MPAGRAIPPNFAGSLWQPQGCTKLNASERHTAWRASRRAQPKLPPISVRSPSPTKRDRAARVKSRPVVVIAAAAGELCCRDPVDVARHDTRPVGLDARCQAPSWSLVVDRSYGGVNGRLVVPRRNTMGRDDAAVGDLVIHHTQAISSSSGSTRFLDFVRSIGRELLRNVPANFTRHRGAVHLELTLWRRWR